MIDHKIILEAEGESIQLFLNDEYIKNVVATSYGYALVNTERCLNSLGKLTQIKENEYILKSKYSIEEIKEKLK